ncbi:transcriptional regulatory protein [Exophiala viscosa]|uniref:Transcriptional regulatory protein n=1 Tax=Exophiala viscosa TaxID=2486360 RepID=A0AAN6IBT0_9EURO|nr:transcriptional regulatory protein [Exophiala viscosa]
MQLPVIGETGRKKRAGRACVLCRSRKVRCDAVLTGNPCTNCRLDSLECVLTKNRRHRVSNANKVRAEKVPETSENTFNHSQQQAVQHEDEKEDDGATPDAATLLANGNGNHGTKAPVEIAPALPSASVAPRDIIYPSLPNFIAPLPESLDEADLIYLRSKKALSLPSDEFRNVCVARYIEFGHPLLPLLDKRQLVLLPHNETSDQFSLLLYQAVMCTGVTFVENELITREGFPSKQAARRAFFYRAKVLFDCNTEPDRFVACQAAVLLSTWYPGKQERADSWFWTGTAVSLAYSIRLHLEPDETRFDVKEQGLRRRLWWCAFSRDQKVSLALGRPSRSTYYNVRILTLEDFDDNVHLSLDHSSTELTSSFDVVEHQKTHNILARLCIEHMKLCICIATFVSNIFECRQQMKSRSHVSEHAQPLPSPSTRLNRCAQDLARWYREVTPDLRYELNDITSSQDSGQQNRCLAVHKSTVHVLYHVAISALYRVKALSPTSSWRDDPGQPDGTSQRILRHTAWELTRVNQDLYHPGLLSYCSTGAVGSVVSAVVIHLLDVKAPNQAVRRAAVAGLQQCKGFLEVLKDSYGTAVDALEYLREAESQDAGLALAQWQDTVSVSDPASLSSPWPDRQPPSSWLSTMLQDPPSAAPEAFAVPGLETSPFKEADEIFWQSWMESASNYDFLEGSSLPLYDLGFSSTDIGNFEIPSVFPEPGWSTLE